MKSYIVDSFTREAFKGNPAGVCFVTEAITDERMLNIAKEFGLSETAFVKKTDAPGVYRIRYFSPKKEIPLCGHATLASAKIIFSNSDQHEIHFITSENLDLLIRRRDESIIMEFPVYDTVEITVPASLLAALGITEITNTQYSPKNKIILLEIKESDALASLKPDFHALLNSYQHINGVLVTAPSANTDYDFDYRYFWPWAGTNEDPVTGGVQTFLAKYWSQRLNKKTMKAFQSSSRSGHMNVELHDEKVWIIGDAVIILEGNLLE